jgi:hypothetical protein
LTLGRRRDLSMVEVVPLQCVGSGDDQGYPSAAKTITIRYLFIIVYHLPFTASQVHIMPRLLPNTTANIIFPTRVC